MFTTLNIKFGCFHLKDEEHRLRESEKMSSMEVIYTSKSFGVINSAQFILVCYMVACLF